MSGPDPKLLRAIARRRAAMAFASRPVPPESLRLVFEAARWAPSSFNEQPWRFVVATKKDDEGYERLASCLSKGNAWAREAPVLILALAVGWFSTHGPVELPEGRGIGPGTERAGESPLVVSGHGAGIVTINQADFAVWLDDAWNNKNFELSSTRYTREADPDGLMSSVFRTGLGNNQMGYSNPEVDELFDKAKQTYDQAERAEYYQQIIDIVLEDAPLVKLASVFPIWAGRSDTVSNVVVLPRGFALFKDLTPVTE